MQFSVNCWQAIVDYAVAYKIQFKKQYVNKTRQIPKNKNKKSIEEK